MSLAASNRYMNVGTTSLATVPITGIQSVGYDAGISSKEASGDADPGPTIAVIDWMNPSFTVTTLDAMVLMAALATTVGTFLMTLLDARNKAAIGGGAKQFTSNALSYLGSQSGQWQHREFATQNLTIKTCWADPETPPVAVSAL